MIALRLELAMSGVTASSLFGPIDLNHGNTDTRVA